MLDHNSSTITVKNQLCVADRTVQGQRTAALVIKAVIESELILSTCWQRLDCELARSCCPAVLPY